MGHTPLVQAREATGGKGRQREAMGSVTFGLDIPTETGSGGKGRQWEAMGSVIFGLDITSAILKEGKVRTPLSYAYLGNISYIYFT